MLHKLFGFEAATMQLKKEVMGGLTAFLTMAYILALVPDILGKAGMDSGAVFTATAISAFVATMIMAIHAKLPFAQAPGVGLSVFFGYTVVLSMGYTWQFALTAVFLEGIIFIIMTLTGIRKKIMNCIPCQLRRAISPGIGLFIAFVGLTNSGIVVSDETAILSLGNVHEPAFLLTCFGIIISSVLLVCNITGGLLIGIIATAIAGIPLGVTHLTNIFSTPPSLEPIFCKFEWANIFTIDMVICVLTFLFIDLFDTMGTLIGVGNRADMLDKDGHFPRLRNAFLADAVGTTLGSVLGVSTVTTFIESASSVAAGARSGLSAFTTAICFIIALFFAPLFLAIPDQATAPALILIGATMMQDLLDIPFKEYIYSIPSFVCIIMMPLTLSISNGIMLGLITYVLIALLSGRWKDLNIGMIILAVLFVLKFEFL